MIQLYPFNSLDIAFPLCNVGVASLMINEQGNPHVAWASQHNGHSSIYYQFWDGLQWSNTGNLLVYSSTDTILPCENMLVSSEDVPQIVFIRKSHTTNYLCVASYVTQWTINQAALGDSVAWYAQTDGNKFVVLTTDGVMHFYTLSGSVLTLVSSSNVLSAHTGRTIIETKSAVFIDSGISYLGIACLLDTAETILVNNIRLTDGVWHASPWAAITGANISDVAVGGINDFFIGWIQHTNNLSTVLLRKVNVFNAISNYYSSSTVFSVSHSILSPQFVAGLPHRLSLCCDATNMYPVKILLCGGQHQLLEVSPATINSHACSIYGSGYDCIPQQVNTTWKNSNLQYAYVNKGVLCFAAGNTSVVAQNLWYDATVLTSRRARYVALRGQVWSKYSEIPCAWNSRTGDIIHESYRRYVTLLAEAGDDLLCNIGLDTSSLSSDSSSLSYISYSFPSAEDLSSSFSSNHVIDMCNMLQRSGVNEEYHETWTLGVPWAGGSCPSGKQWGLRATFKTYSVPDRLTITFYNSAGAVLSTIASGCIATASLPGGVWTKIKQIPIGTLTATLVVTPNCSGTHHTRWVVRMTCECFDNETSSSSSLSLSSSSSSSHH